MTTSIEIIGVYPVQNNNEVHLIEIAIKDSNQKLNLSEITQEIPGRPNEYWQAPWDAKLLDEAGEIIIADDYSLLTKPELLAGTFRLIFFFHYLDFSKPLITPFGSVNLQGESKKPQRLSSIIYESPD